MFFGWLDGPTAAGATMPTVMVDEGFTCPPQYVKILDVRVVAPVGDYPYHEVYVIGESQLEHCPKVFFY